MKAVFLQKNHGALHQPKFSTLAEQMNQGGGYRNGAPPRSLSAQMMQPGGYSQKPPAKTLGEQMGQR